MASILIVDDRPVSRRLMIASLSAEGHRFFEASDGREGLEVARREKPDLVLTDVMMPTMDGYEFVRQLRLDPQLAATPVIFVTAHDLDQEAIATARAAGVRDVLLKPFDSQTLLFRVAAALRRDPPAPARDQLAEKEEQLRRANRRLETLIDLGLRLGSELDPRRLMRSFCHAAREIIGARAAIVGVIDGDVEQLRYLYTSGMDAEATARLGSPSPRQGPFRTVIAENRALRLTNARGDPAALGFPPSHPPVQSWLGAPITSPAGIYGFIGLIDKLGVAEFSEEDERLVSILAAQAGRSYQSVTMYADVERHASELERQVVERKRVEERQALSLAVNRALSESSTIADACHRVLGAICTRLGWDLGTVWVIDRTANVLRPVAVWQASARRFPESEALLRTLVLPPGPSLPGRVFLQGAPVWIADLARDPHFIRAETATGEGLRAAFAFPIKLGEQVVGAIELFSGGVRELDRDIFQITAGITGPLAQFLERKQAEDELQRAQQRLQRVITSSPAVLYTLHVAGEVLVPTWISENVRELLGSGAGDFGRPGWWNDRIHEHDREPVWAKIRANLKSAGRIADEYRLRHDDGSYRWLHSEMRLLDNGPEAGAEIVGSWIDITERKLLEDQFRQAQKMEAIGMLAGGVAHDFNNLLSVIIGYSDVLLSDLERGDPAREGVDEIRKAGNRAATLTRQLLAFSRKQVLVPVVLDLNALLANMENMLSRLIGEDIDLRIVAAPRLWLVKADEGQMEQIVLNLAINARDAMPRGGKLTIETRNVAIEPKGYFTAQIPPGEYAMFSVADNGAGMSAEIRAHIFEPFFTTKGPEKGTGLGLATVWGIVKQSGGHITVDSELGVGTTFRVYLPRYGELHAAIASPSADAARPLSGAETIMLVEDEGSVRTLLKLILQSYGYTVLEAPGGPEALRIAERHEGVIHLLITDVVMPTMSGRELAERFVVLRPGVRVLYVSGYTNDAVMRHGIVDAKMLFVQKPVSPVAFARKVREAIES